MSYATLAYIPPERLNRDAFLRNLGSFKHEYPVYLYSDCWDDGEGNTIKIPDPTNIKLSKNRVAIHNRLWLHAVEIAQQKELKRFIFLEPDCRVGHDFWDKRVFDEAEQYNDMFASGTPAVYNFAKCSKYQTQSIISESEKYFHSSGFSVPHFNSPTKRPLGAWFIMGGGGCYSAPIMADLFMGFERDANQKAMKVPAFDLYVGLRCFQLFGAKAVHKLPFLTSVFSTFGNKINSESDRISMVKSGKYSVVHQIKSDKDCL